MTNTTTDGGHLWATHYASGYTYCSACGIVKRADGSNKTCPGPTPAVEGLWGGILR